MGTLNSVLFSTHLILEISAPPSDVADQLASRITPLKLTDDFEKSLHPRGTVVEFVSDGRFEIK